MTATTRRATIHPMSTATTDKEVIAWINTLTPAQMLEYTDIEEVWSRNQGDTANEAKGVCKDWIEEHGGRRNWWGDIYGQYEE